MLDEDSRHENSAAEDLLRRALLDDSGGVGGLPESGRAAAQ